MARQVDRRPVQHVPHLLEDDVLANLRLHLPHNQGVPQHPALLGVPPPCAKHESVGAVGAVGDPANLRGQAVGARVEREHPQRLERGARDAVAALVERRRNNTY